MTEPAKPALKCEVRTYRVVDYRDLAAYISQVLGIQITGHDLSSAEVWQSDSVNEYHVTGKVGDGDAQRVQQFLRGNLDYHLSSVLNHMAARGQLEPGYYLIEGI